MIVAELEHLYDGSHSAVPRALIELLKEERVKRKGALPAAGDRSKLQIEMWL